MNQKSELFSDTIRISEIDKDGKYFEKVSRIEAVGEETDCKVSLDINTDIYSVNKDSIYSILLVTSLDGNTHDNKFSYDIFQKKNTLMDSYEYVMHGKIFRYQEERNGLEIQFSFGGLLLGLYGNPKVLKEFKVDERVFLLMKKITNY